MSFIFNYFCASHVRMIILFISNGLGLILLVVLFGERNMSLWQVQWRLRGRKLFAITIQLKVHLLDDLNDFVLIA